jgi:hypothetical protein
MGRLVLRAGFIPSAESLALIHRRASLLLRALRLGPRAEARLGRSNGVNRRIYMEKLWELDRAMNPDRVPLSRFNPDRTTAQDWPAEVEEGIRKLNDILEGLMRRWGVRWLSAAVYIDDLWSGGYEMIPDRDEVFDRWPDLRGRFEWEEVFDPEVDDRPVYRKRVIPDSVPWEPHRWECDGIRDALDLIREGARQALAPPPAFDPSRGGDDCRARFQKAPGPDFDSPTGSGFGDGPTGIASKPDPDRREGSGIREVSAEPVKPDNAPAPAEIDYAAEFRRRNRPTPATLLTLMAGRESVPAQEVADQVHGDPQTSNKAIRANITRTNQKLEEMAAPFRFRLAGGFVFKEPTGGGCPPPGCRTRSEDKSPGSCQKVAREWPRRFRPSGRFSQGRLGSLGRK